MKNTNLIIGSMVLLIILAGGVYVATKKPTTQNTISMQPTITPYSMPTGERPTIAEPTRASVTSPTAAAASGKKTEKQIADELRLGGSSYLDTKGVYSFLYPNDYKQDVQSNNMVRIYKNGPSQKGQTEMYDGVIMLFESVDLGGKTLEQWVDTAIQTATSSESTLKVPKKSVTQNGYAGFTYTLEGLGETKYLVMRKNAQSTMAVSIAMGIFDPTNAGFQNEVNAILSTVQLLK